MIILAIESSCDETGVGIAELGSEPAFTTFAPIPRMVSWAEPVF